MRFCACLDGTKTFLFLVLVLVLQPCLKYFCREYTSSASSVKRHKFMLTTCTRLILFTLFYFCFFFYFFVWQVNHFGYLSVKLIHFSRWTHFGISVSKFLPCTHHSSTNDFSQSFLLVKIIVLYYVFHQNCSR